jgi:hypothetical protein
MAAFSAERLRPDADKRHLYPRRPLERRDEPRIAFRAAIAHYKSARLGAMRLAQGAEPCATEIRPSANADEICDFLDRPEATSALVARLSASSRIALCVFPLLEAMSLPLSGLNCALGILGADSNEGLTRLLELGLLAVEPDPTLPPIGDFSAALDPHGSHRRFLRVHPAVARAARTTQSERRLKPSKRGASLPREADGLQPILALAALWQRVASEPLRRTLQQTLYKRDLERIENDPVLAGPIYDALDPLPDASAFWLALARSVELIVADPAGDALVAAPPQFWEENALHLPQMIATAWLALDTYLESGAALEVGARSALPYLRVATLLSLSTLGESEWIAVEDLAEQFSEFWPAWDCSWLFDERRSIVADRSRRDARRRRPAAALVRGSALLKRILGGAAYPLGLVKVAEEQGAGRLLVQLSNLGRYVLALGPAPPPRPAYEHFLLVQPNFEMIAYRQGLTPQSAGLLARFAWYSQVGAALELALTRESVELGLAEGLTCESILQVLALYSQRELPPNVSDAINRWASRRERVTYYETASLIEFASASERETALGFWGSPLGAAPVPVGERFLLVEDQRTVPFDRLRLTSSRDYRLPPEICVAVEPDGVTLALDPARADLLVDAELLRFADELPAPTRGQGRVAADHNAQRQAVRRFAVTAESLARGLRAGLNALQLAQWFAARTGGSIPPAVGLLLAARGPQRVDLAARRVIVLNLSSAELLDGLLQHPATRPHLAERLGPLSVVVPGESAVPLRNALLQLGLTLEIE